MNTWPFHDDLTLAAMPTTVYWARRHAEDVLGKWNLGPLMETAELLVSELVTNAVKASGVELPERPTYIDLRQIKPIRLRLSSDRWRLLVEVWDSCAEPPVLKEPDLESESGRGLFLVARMANQWNYYFPPEGGKVVWFELGPIGGVL
jgi:anti-sigma regulatory factor (Ser/Thr protein kinase)